VPFPTFVRDELARLFEKVKSTSQKAI